VFHRRNRIVLAAGIVISVIVAMAGPASARSSAAAQTSTGTGVNVTGSLSWTWTDAPISTSSDTVTGDDTQTGTFSIDLTGEDTNGYPTADNSTYSVTDNYNITSTDNQTGCASNTTGSSSASGSFPLTPTSGSPYLYAAVIPTNSYVDVIIGVPFSESQTTTWTGPTGPPGDCYNGTSTDTVSETATPACLTSTGGDDGDTGVLQGTYPNGTVTLGCSGTYNTGSDTGSFSITGTLTVGGGQCAAAGSIVCIAAVRYAPRADDDDNNTPGLPVIKDDGPEPVFDHDYGSDLSCNGLADPQDYDWLDCASSGTPDKDWPVIYAARDALDVDAVVLFSTVKLQNPGLTATATVGGQTLTLPCTSLTSTALADGKYELSADGLGFSGNLPSTPSDSQLTIDWTVTEYADPTDCESAGGGSASGESMPAGESSTPVYVTFAPYLQPHNEGTVLPYISMLDVGTTAAAGATSPQDAFDGIWDKFASLDIDHPILDPDTGNVTYGPALKYYDDGYDTIADWWNEPLGSCPLLYTFLATDSGHCGNWAQFLAGVLGWQGVQATYVSLRRYGVSVPGFYPGPEPAPGDAADDYAYMLIDPPLWSFATKNAAGPYPYADTLTVKGGTVSVGSQSFTYNPGPPISQGDVSTPPEMFATGDHAIVLADEGYVDPSYGNPPDDTPYSSLAAYETAAIAGFAVIYAQIAGIWIPLPLGADMQEVCTVLKCQFRAVPYDQSGAP
jgi:hypothetical protein